MAATADAKPFSEVGVMILIPAHAKPDASAPIASALGKLLLTFDQCIALHGGSFQLYPELSHDRRFFRLMLLWNAPLPRGEGSSYWNNLFAARCTHGGVQATDLQDYVAYDDPQQITDSCSEDSDALVRGLPVLRGLHRLIERLDAVTASWMKEYSVMLGRRGDV